MPNFVPFLAVSLIGQKGCTVFVSQVQKNKQKKHRPLKPLFFCRNLVSEAKP